MLLAEELLLLAIDPDDGRPVKGSERPLTPCLNGALVAELALDGLVRLVGGKRRFGFDDERFEVTGSLPPAGLLRDAYAALDFARGRHSEDQLNEMDEQLGRVWRRVVDGLIKQGVLGRDDRGFFRIVTAHPVLQPTLRAEVVTRLRAAAAADGELEPRTAVVLAFVGPAQLLEVVADRPHAHAKRRIAEASEAIPIADPVKKVIAAAVTAARFAESAKMGG